MAEPVWDATKWQFDRFNLSATPTSTPGYRDKMMSFLSQSKPVKMINTCQVDNCTADVSRMKEYHTRYKICEPHLKAMLVVKDGRNQRFCQQCGKFHDVEEFDGDKRSCRERLQKHNARRRRMREMQHMLRTTGHIDEHALQAKYGLTEGQLAPKVQKLARQMAARKTPTGETGSGTMDTSGSHGDRATQGTASPTTTSSMAQLDLLNEAFLEDVLGPATLAKLPNLAANMAMTQQVQNGNAFMQLDASAVMDLDDINVLEELTRGFGLNPADVAMAAVNGGRSSAPCSEDSSSTPVPTATFTAAPAPAPAMPVHPAALHAAHAAASFPYLLPSHGYRGSAPVVTTGISGLPPYLQSAPSAGTPVVLRGAGSSSNALVPPSGVAGPHAASINVSSASSASSSATVLEEALNLLAYDQQQVRYIAQDKLTRFSAKLFGCTPADLPHDLKASLVEMLASDSMEGYIRPGCVHLEVNSMLGPEEQAVLAARGMRAAVEAFIARSPEMATAAHTLLLQLGSKIAVVRDGCVIHVIDTAHAARLLPAVAAVRPLALPVPAASGPSFLELSLWGYNLGKPDDTVLARSQGRHLDVEVLGVTSDPSWDNMQRLDVRIAGPFSPGCLQVEVMRGAYMSAHRTAVLASCVEQAAEIRTLESMPDVGEVDTLLYEIGAVVEAAVGGAAAAAAPAPAGIAACRILPFAVQRKWPSLMRAALDVCAAVLGASEAAAAVDAASLATTAMPLLALVVRTQVPEMVHLLLDWAKSNGLKLSSTAPGQRGLTALHLAALIRDDGAIAAALTAACPDALAGWDGAPADDGSTPLALATRLGTAPAMERVVAEAQYHHATAAINASGCGKLAAAPAGPPSAPPFKSAKGGPSPSCDLPASSSPLAQEPHTKRESLLAQAGATGPFLRFASPALEARYASWYHVGQVPVDLVFMVIAILSQGAWVFRWDLDRSAFLGWLMVSLMCLNVAYMHLALMWPSAYVRHREALCVASLVLHKVAQMLVTVLPGAGTVYSPTYNITVALLESSSFAQIAMLSFGAKARVAYHLPTCVAMLGLSIAINPFICAGACPGAGPLTCSLAVAAFQTVCCCVLPCGCVYLSERHSRRIFLETVVD